MTTATRVIIYGKEGCPYTAAARENYAQKGVDVEYVDVRRSDANLQRMLQASGGRREVPVIVEKGAVTVGFGGT